MVAQFDAEAQRVGATITPGPRLVVIGSTSFWGPDSGQLCEAIAADLAALPALVAVTGGMSGVGLTFGRAFADARRARGRAENLFHLLPRELQEGDKITLPVEKVSDWFLDRLGRGLGGFTVSRVWSQLSQPEQESARNEAPFSWFMHRGTTSARDELLALPKCTRCGKRNIGYPEDTEQPCALCRTDCRRCNCPNCGAPLIRNAKLPPLCASCLPARK
jgi:hypothetical protein